jgi:hypothetical protein
MNDDTEWRTEDSSLSNAIEGKIRAGTTLKFSGDVSTALPNSWSVCDPSDFSLRVGPDYNRNKLKKPSVGSAMETVGVDFFKSDTRLSDIGARVSLPSSWTTYDNKIKTDTIKVPPLLIVNFQFPSSSLSGWFNFFGSAIDDGPGYSVVLYCRMTTATEEQLLLPSDQIPGAMKLLVEFLQSFAEDTDAAVRDKFKDRFKLITFCQNANDFNLSSFILSFNGKPVLLRNVLDFVVGDGYREVNINMHKFGNMAKQAMMALYPT